MKYGRPLMAYNHRTTERVWTKRDLKKYAKRLAGGAIHSSLSEGWPHSLSEYTVEPWTSLSTAEQDFVAVEIENIAYRLTEKKLSVRGRS